MPSKDLKVGANRQFQAKMPKYKDHFCHQNGKSDQDEFDDKAVNST